jgi:tetratricopeptide (TPR) repeat protein
LQSQGKYQAARAMLEKSWRICQACDHPDGASPEPAEWAAFCLHSLGQVTVAQGDYVQGKQFAQKSLDFCQGPDSQWDRAWALLVLGWAAYDLGEYAPGQQFIRQSLDLHRQLGNRQGEAACLNILGLIICGLYEGDADKYEDAREFFEQNLALRQAIDDRRGEAAAQHNLGYIHFKLRQYNRARARFEASLEISNMIASLNIMSGTGMWLGMLALEQQDFPGARRYLVEALKIAHENNALSRVTDVLYRIGDLLRRTGQPEAAVEYLTFVQVHPATDDRVRTGANEFLDELAAVLPPEILEAAQARGRAHALDELVSKVVLDQK